MQLLLAITTSGVRHWLEDWAPLSEWGVAIGTGALAFWTFKLARRVARQVDVEKEQLVAAHRPLVVPTREDEIGNAPHLWLNNSGSGAALNVRGAIHWSGTPGGAGSLHPQVMAAGSEVRRSC